MVKYEEECCKGCGNMTEVHYCILHCLKKLNGERTVASVYHLFNGKRSGQTIQDGHVYAILVFFSMFKGMSEKKYNGYVKELVDFGYIEEVDFKIYTVTDIGQKILEAHQKTYSIPKYMNGYLYGEDARQFWLRLSLLIQTLSQLQHKKNIFVPIEDNKFVQDHVRNYLLKSPFNNVDELACEIGREIKTLLKNVPEIEAKIFIKRLTGYKRAGLTYKQIGEEFKLDEIRVYLLFMNTLHYFLQSLKDDTSFSLCQLYVPRSQGGLSESTKQTYNLLQKGLSLKEISTYRGLKESTIEDHIVELVVASSLINLDEFLTDEEYEKIKKAADVLKTSKLKAIKNFLGESTSYFAIRLVLAKEGVTNEY